MTLPADAASPTLAHSATPTAVRPWRIALLWAGLPLCLFGMVLHGLWQQWAPGRLLELMVFALIAWSLAWPLRRVSGWSSSSALAAIWVAALAVFAEPLPLASTLVLALAAVAAGGWVANRMPIALQAACGLALIGTILGWLLPLPIHARWIYLLACTVLIVCRREALRQAMFSMRADWTRSTSAAPRAATFAIMALGLASTGAWLPTLQVDDLGYHLRLPWQLLAHARYPMDAENHMWALAPWLGDVLQAVPMLIGNAEARGPVNALWMVITAAGVWHLAKLMDDHERSGWLAVALYASLPLTPVLAASMQTETPTAALLIWLVWLIAAKWHASMRALACVAILVAGLLALKLAAAASALLLLPWVGWRHRRELAAWQWLVAGLASLALGTSSYLYAAIHAGNPFLPLFNASFASPYALAFDFDDIRWHAGFDALLPWQLTFDSGRYLESFGGAAGFMLVALAGAWLLALFDRRTSALALVATALFVVPLLPMQYLRYAFPASVVLATVMAVAVMRNHERRGAGLLIVVCVLNLAFQANGHWMLRTGAVKQTFLSMGADHPLYLRYAPERMLAKKIREQAPEGNVLALDPDIAFSAELGARARTTSPYDPSLHAAATLANADVSGQQWESLLKRERIDEILLRATSLTSAQRNGIARSGGTLRAQEGDSQWWSLATPQAPR